MPKPTDLFRMVGDEVAEVIVGEVKRASVKSEFDPSNNVNKSKNSSSEAASA